MQEIKTPENCIPLNRLYECGASALSEIELLSIVIGNGISTSKALEISNSVLAAYSLHNIGAASLEQLRQVPYITSSKAGMISAVMELAKRYECSVNEKPTKISSPEAAYQYLYPSMKGQMKEYFISLLLDTKNNLLKKDVVSIGSLNANIVHPREVFKPAILYSAAAIIVAHNHPSGETSPSQNDIDITRKLVETGKICGIELYDHIIIGDGRFLSMKEQNLI